MLNHFLASDMLFLAFCGLRQIEYFLPDILKVFSATFQNAGFWRTLIKLLAHYLHLLHVTLWEEDIFLGVCDPTVYSNL